MPAATVRSARRMRLLRKPYGQCHSSAALLSLSTQSAICFASSSKQLFPFWKQLAACLRKSATGSFIAVTGIASPATPIFFLRKRNKNKDERTVRTNGDLPLGSQSGQPRYGTVCGCRFRLSELYQHLELTMTEYGTTIHERKGLCGKMYFCRSLLLPNGKTEACFGTPWKKTKRPRTAALHVSSFLLCLLS